MKKKNKKPTRLEKIYLSRVADLGCCACASLGYEHSPAEIHHISTGGRGLRATHYETIPLCPHHHRIGGHGEAIHAGRETWEGKFKTEAEYLEETQAALRYDPDID